MRMEETIKLNAGTLSLGEVVAERIFTFGPDGAETEITVRLGAPRKDESLGDYGCPVTPHRIESVVK
jgi:hypothetical protein